MSVPTRPYGLPVEIERLLARVKVDFPSDVQQPSPVRLAIATAVCLVGSVAVDAVLVAIGTTIFTSTKHYTHFRLSDYGKLTSSG